MRFFIGLVLDFVNFKFIRSVDILKIIVVFYYGILKVRDFISC